MSIEGLSIGAEAREPKPKGNPIEEPFVLSEEARNSIMGVDSEGNPIEEPDEYEEDIEYPTQDSEKESEE